METHPGIPKCHKGEVTWCVYIAGCTGALAHELAREYSALKVTVFDLPEVIEDVKCFQPDGPHTEQVSFVPGQYSCVFTSGQLLADL